MAALVLASGSPWRAELLARLDLPFECQPADYDERAHDHRFTELGPEGYALLLATGKAEAVGRERPADWILAADQIAVLDSIAELGEPAGPILLHKPGTEDRAVAQLMQLRGRSHRLLTAVVLRGPNSSPGFVRHEFDTQLLTMREFPEAEARAYVERYRPIASVGSYHIEDAGIKLFERIDGDHTGVMGLPLLAVCRLLRAAELL
jgi:septum formation protein